MDVSEQSVLQDFHLEWHKKLQLYHEPTIAYSPDSFTVDTLPIELAIADKKPQYHWYPCLIQRLLKKPISNYQECKNTIMETFLQIL